MRSIFPKLVNIDQPNVHNFKIAALSHHDLNGSSSYPVYLSIGNLGNLSIMGEKWKPAILADNYWVKYPPQFESSDGQDSTRFVSVLGVASPDWPG